MRRLPYWIQLWWNKQKYMRSRHSKRQSVCTGPLHYVWSRLVARQTGTTVVPWLSGRLGLPRRRSQDRVYGRHSKRQSVCTGPLHYVWSRLVARQTGTTVVPWLSDWYNILFIWTRTLLPQKKLFGSMGKWCSNSSQKRLQLFDRSITRNSTRISAWLEQLRPRDVEECTFKCPGSWLLQFCFSH